MTRDERMIDDTHWHLLKDNRCCLGAGQVVTCDDETGQLGTSCDACEHDLIECECGQMVRDETPSPAGHWCYALAGQDADDARELMDGRWD